LNTDRVASGRPQIFSGQSIFERVVLMKDSNDIANLYKTLGQNPNQYQEVVRDEELAQANERWPLIAAMHDSDFSPPPVDQKKRGPRERAPLVTLEHENELEVGAHDYHQRVETANVMALLANPAMTPTWAPDMHEVPEVLADTPPQDVIETGWVAPERTPAQIELAAQAAQAAQAAHQAQLIKEAQAAKEAQAQRDLEAAEQEQAEMAAEAAKAVGESKADIQALAQVQAAQIAREMQAAQALQATQQVQLAKVTRETAVVAQLIANIEVNPKVVATVGTSIFQDDTKVVFAGAPASIFTEATLAESLMDEAASEYDEMSGDSGQLLDDDLEPFVEEEIAPVVANPKRQRVVVEPAPSPKALAAKPVAIAAKPVALVVEKITPTTALEPASVVTLTHMRMRATGEPRPLAALFSRLSGGEATPSGAAAGKKSLLFERMKRT
jgi:hypothetical protein